MHEDNQKDSHRRMPECSALRVRQVCRSLKDILLDYNPDSSLRSANGIHGATNDHLQFFLSIRARRHRASKNVSCRIQDESGRTYKLKERPDVTERKEKAIEAIAASEDGRTLAIEHTYVQPFVGERADAVPFQTIFEQLHSDSRALATPAGGRQLPGEPEACVQGLPVQSRNVSISRA